MPGPDGRRLLVAGRRVQGLHERVHLGRHDGEHRHRLITGDGEGVPGSGGYDDVLAGPENPPLTADQHLERAGHEAEALVGGVVHVRRGLVAGVGPEVPTADHEVGHQPLLGCPAERPSGQPVSRSAAAATRSSVAVSATRTCRPPAGP